MDSTNNDTMQKEGRVNGVWKENSEEGPEKNDAALRQKMKSYWKVYSPTLESMMLSHDAKYLAENEQNEIISYLPNYRAKKVLELGAGIGRFTARLALVADHVTAVDFMQEYIDQNQRDNEHIDNISFKCADVTKLDFPAGSFDIVFSNWLFMYLSDEETKNVFKKVIRWLNPGGYFFLRESCYHQSGNVKRNENPTIYRTPLDYCEYLQNVTTPDEAAFKIIRGKNILSYIQYHSNPNQLCFLAKRVDGLESYELAQFMQARYNLENILMGERMFGYMWFSTGGEATNRELCTRLELQPGQKVLDIGCGTGANAFFMARHYGANVHGIDLSTYMIHVAIERQGKLEPMVKKRVQFEINDILAIDHDEEAYDVIYSRDAILHIPDKHTLLKKLYKWLKPGGTLFFTDYLRGLAPSTQEFEDHVRNRRKYSLATEEFYKEELMKSGFKNIQTEERKEEFITILQKELDSFVSGREAFLKDFSQEMYDEYSQTWMKKIRWTKNGQLTWGIFMARK